MTENQFKFECPSCGRKSKAKREWVGRRARCKCGATVLIERPKPEISATKPGSLIHARPDSQAGADAWMDDEEVFDSGPLDAESLFRAAVRKAFDDGVVTADERTSLEELRGRYGISLEVARHVFQEEKNAALLRVAHAPTNALNALTIAPLLSLATAASEAGNHEEAYNYCNRALEQDPRNHHAWFGKAKSAGWSSTLATFRLPEMVSGLQRAIEYAPSAEQDALLHASADVITSVTQAYYLLARQHLEEFAQLESSWGEYLQRCEGMIAGLTVASQMTPNPDIAQFAIRICVDNIAGVRYTDFDGSAGVRSITSAYEAQLRSTMERFAGELRRFDPGYRLPEVQKASACFVITAAMGDAMHPFVIELQEFRSSYLVRRRWGRLAIRVYLRVGPPCASVIARHVLIQKVVYFGIVYPSLLISRALATRRRCPLMHVRDCDC